MKAAYVEFRLESATMNTREFYASRQGTYRYLTKESVGCAITYSEALQRSKKDEWFPLAFGFECTPAAPVDVRTQLAVYKAGDTPNAGLLRYGRQELLMPGSVFRFVAWGSLPPLWVGQVFLIAKKRAAACVTRCVLADPEPNTTAPFEAVMPIQVSPSAMVRYRAFVPLVLTARYAIIQAAVQPDSPRLVINGWAVPLEA